MTAFQPKPEVSLMKTFGIFIALSNIAEIIFQSANKHVSVEFKFWRFVKIFDFLV